MGCKLVFEPSTAAVERLLKSMPTGDNRVVREMCDGEDVCQKLNEVYGLIKSNWYNAKPGFFTIKQVEIAEDTGRSFVYVDIDIPQSSGSPLVVQLVFEMERVRLRWHIYSVDGIEEFLRRAQGERGIL